MKIWTSLGLLTSGVVLGGLLTFGGLALAGKLKPPSEPAVLVALATSVDAADRIVDIKLDKGDVAGAIAELEKLRQTEWPARDKGGDASVQLRHDTYGRLLQLRLDNPSVDSKTTGELLELADEGLGREWEQLDPNPFTARLLALRGIVLDEAGRDDEALLNYQQAIDMNTDLLEELRQADQ